MIIIHNKLRRPIIIITRRILLRMDCVWLAEFWETKTYLTKTTGSMSASTTQWVHVVITYDNGTQLCSLSRIFVGTHKYIFFSLLTSGTGVHEAFLKAKLDHSVAAPNGKIYTFGQNEKIKIEHSYKVCPLSCYRYFQSHIYILFLVLWPGYLQPFHRSQPTSGTTMVRQWFPILVMAAATTAFCFSSPIPSFCLQGGEWTCLQKSSLDIIIRHSRSTGLEPDLETLGFRHIAHDTPIYAPWKTYWSEAYLSLLPRAYTCLPGHTSV